MIKALDDLQELRRRIYRKAKSDKTHRFWGLFVHVTKRQTLEEAYRIAKGNRGAPGIDGQSFEDIEAAGVTDFLEAIRDDLVTGRYQPKPNRWVKIPKDNGKVRTLQIPTVSDRIAQAVVKGYLEPELEKHFHPDSYGYRPRKSALQAVGVARERCWRYAWALDLDIRAFFDSMSHELLLRAVRKHTDCAWALLHIERWLQAPVQLEDGTLEPRQKGTPQGSVVTLAVQSLFALYVRSVDGQTPSDYTL
jgi:RNA-directed DNA polymerase